MGCLLADDKVPQNKWQIKVPIGNLTINLLLSLYTIHSYDLCGVIWVNTFWICPSEYLAAFCSFLRSEFSEENIQFWLACEDFKSTASPDDIRWKAEEIYREFVEPTACREVSAGDSWRTETELRVQRVEINSVPFGILSMIDINLNIHYIFQNWFTEQACVWSRQCKKCC